MSDHIAGEVFKALIQQAEGDGRLAVRSDCPVAHVIANEATVKGVDAVVLILRNVVGIAIDGESTVLDAVGITTDNRAKEGAIGLTVVQILDGVIIAHNHVLDIAITIGDCQGGETRAVRNKLGGDILSLDGVALEVII